MSALSHLRMLTRYSTWANTLMFDVLATLPSEQVNAVRVTLFGSMVNTLNHSLVIDKIWQAHLQGRAHGFTKRITDSVPALADLRSAQAELDAWFVQYADGLDPVTEAQVVNFEFVDGGNGAMTRGDILLHIVNHKTYHRGVVADMLYQAGSKPPVMDLPVFLRDTSPAG